MKIRTDLSAGMTFQECDQARNYWKDMAQRGHSNISPPSTGGTVTTAVQQPVYQCSALGAQTSQDPDTRPVKS